MDDMPLTAAACEAWLLRDVIAATAPGAETPEEARLRAAAIVSLYRGFEPATTMEAMLACQAIALRFVVSRAVRDLSACAAGAKILSGMRAQTNALSKTEAAVMTRFERLKARRLAMEKSDAKAGQEAAPV